MMRLRSLDELKAKMKEDPLSFPGLLEGSPEGVMQIPVDVLRKYLGSPDQLPGKDIARKITDNETAQGLLGPALDYGPALQPFAMAASKNVRNQRAKIFGKTANPSSMEMQDKHFNTIDKFAQKEFGMEIKPSRGKIDQETGERRLKKGEMPVPGSGDAKPDWRSGDLESQFTNPNAAVHELGHLVTMPEGMTMGEYQTLMDSQVGEASKAKRSAYDHPGEVQARAVENQLRRMMGLPATDNSAAVKPGQGPRIGMDGNPRAVRIPRGDGEVDLLRQSRLQTPETKERMDQFRKGDIVIGKDGVIDNPNALNASVKDYKKLRPTDPESYVNLRDQSDKANFLSPTPASELGQHKLFTSKEGVGYALSPEGDLQGLVNNSGRKGAGTDGAIHAVGQGAKTLDAYDPVLPKIYNKVGFEETSRLPFSEEYAPKGWPYEQFGKPDVVFMQYPPDLPRDANSIRARIKANGLIGERNGPIQPNPSPPSGGIGRGNGEALQPPGNEIPQGIAAPTAKTALGLLDVKNPPGSKIADASEVFQSRGQQPPSTDTKLAQIHGQAGEVRDAVPELLKRAETDMKIKKQDIPPNTSVNPRYEDPFYVDEHQNMERASAYDNPKNRKPDSVNAMALGGGMPFDPDKYLAEKTGSAPAAQGFDPDKYLAEKTGERPWYDVSLPGTIEAFRDALPIPTHMPQTDPNRPWYDVSAKGTGQAFLNAAPGIGAAAGMAVAGPVGGALGGMAGESGRSAAQSVIDDQNPTRKDFYSGLLRSGMHGAEGAMTADVLTHRLGGAMGVKENAPDIIKATERLGGKVTPGQVSASPVVQGYESSLEQSPTIGGAMVRGKTAPIRHSMQTAAESLLQDRAGELDPHAAGLQARGQMIQDAESKFAAPKKLYENLQQYTKDINATENSTKAVARNVMNIPGVGIKGSPAESVANWVNDTLIGKEPGLENQITADQIKMLKTRVGKKAEDLRGQGNYGDAGDVSEIYDKLRRMQESSIKRGILYSARTKGEGDTIAKGMLGQLKSANEGFRNASKDIKNVVQRTGVASDVNSLGHFKDIMNQTNTTDLQRQLLSLGNTEGNEALYNFSPKTAALLRKMRLEDVARKSSDMNKNMSANGLLKATKNITPRDAQMLFGKDAGTLGDMREVNASFPKKTGASDTPRGIEYSEGQTFDPVGQIEGLLKYLGYRTLGSGAINAARALEETPGLVDTMAKKPLLKSGLLNLGNSESESRRRSEKRH